MRMVFSEVVGTLSFLQPQADDDMADRLHYYYTTTFLLVTSVLISLKMYGGRPIECWMPAEYQSSWQEYTEMYCFSMNTYYAPFSGNIPSDNEERQRNMISYYQWTPFFLVICAFLFYSPCLIWRIMYTKSGIRIKDIIAFANDRSNIQPKMREANMKGMSAHLGSVFRHRYRFGDGTLHPYHHRFLRMLNFRFYEAYLTSLYMGIKLLFLANVSCQMFLMNWFLQTSNYRYYGFGVLQDLIYGKAWTDSGNFPRVTYCDMDIRILGNVQKHTVQCVLVINIFIEKVFVLLWIWYSLLLVATIFSLANWALSSLPFEARKRFIARRLELADIEFKPKIFEQELEEFVRDFIKMDGVFMLRMLTIHSGILVCTEVVDCMWENFIESTGRLRKPERSVSELSTETDQAHASPTTATSDRRKTSVLVPLVSAHPNGMNQAGFFFQPPSSMLHPPSHSTPLTAPTGASLAAAATQQLLVPKSEFLLKKPNPHQYRYRRLLRSSMDISNRGAGGAADPARQARAAPSTIVGGRHRRTSQGLPLLSAAFGGAMASLNARRHSATQHQHPTISESVLVEVENNGQPQQNVDVEDETDEEAAEEEEQERHPTSSQTWHASAKRPKK